MFQDMELIRKPVSLKKVVEASKDIYIYLNGNRASHGLIVIVDRYFVTRLIIIYRIIVRL